MLLRYFDCRIVNIGVGLRVSLLWYHPLMNLFVLSAVVKLIAAQLLGGVEARISHLLPVVAQVWIGCASFLASLFPDITFWSVDLFGLLKVDLAFDIEILMNRVMCQLATGLRHWHCYVWEDLSFWKACQLTSSTLSFSLLSPMILLTPHNYGVLIKICCYRSVTLDLILVRINDSVCLVAHATRLMSLVDRRLMIFVLHYIGKFLSFSIKLASRTEHIIFNLRAFVVH